MKNWTYTIYDAEANVKADNLESWLNRWFDLLLIALDSLSEQPKQPIVIEMIRQLRMEIVIGNRLSQAGQAQPCTTSARTTVKEQLLESTRQAELTRACTSMGRGKSLVSKPGASTFTRHNS